MPDLFDPIDLGAIAAKNRIFMAPMTRNRADRLGCLPDFAADYYAQRAGAGLIVTEGTQTSWEGQGYARTPGLHTPDQVNAWRCVTDAVHAAGGRIVVQLMHAGRVAHPLNRQTDAQPVAPSAIAPANTPMYTDESGMQPIPTPRALETSEIGPIVSEYASAARNAIDAGFDGVELHAASGYLPMQFLSSETNQRSGRYGGSLPNRMRFIIEVMEALAGTAGGGRVGIKLSPGIDFNECIDADPAATYSALVTELNQFDLAYLHVAGVTDEFDVHGTLRPLFDGPYVAGAGLRVREDADSLLRDGLADATIWATRFIANPDLPERLHTGGPFAEPVEATFYTPGPEGYVDYPFLPTRHLQQAGEAQ